MIFSATGHRPNKLFNSYPETRNYQLLVNFAEHIIKQYASEIDSFGCGMALGWDMACAEACIRLNIPFVACIPFKNQSSNWPKRTQEYYDNLLKYAFMEICVSEGSYSPLKIQVRNEFMVNNSGKIIALWDGTKGGTCNCINYAKSKKVEVINCWQEYQEGLISLGIIPF